MIDALDALDARTSLLAFAKYRLGIDLYDWQKDVINPFDDIAWRMTQVSLASPNEAGKSSFVIPVIALGLLATYREARVVLTTADGKQLDNQVMPAIEAHRAKFPTWKFNERQITTPTGGRFVAFTTDDPGRAEGWQPSGTLDGPLVIMVDEAKTVKDEIFTAFDRCGYTGLLLTSSPGKMRGMFYDSQFNPALDFIRVRVGLKDCPHISQDKIDRIIAKHGPNSPFTRSALHGEFIELYEGDPVYYAYSQQVHEFDALPWPTGATLCVGMDVGTHNSCVIAAVKTDRAGATHVWILREIVLTGSDTDRQCVELLKVLATEFPFWNLGLPVCPQTLFFCDPAARNSSFTSRGPNASALKVIHSHNIFPGMKTGLHLQPSIATVNRLLQQNTAFRTGEVSKTVWNFRINVKKCPTLADGFRGRYRYPSKDEPGYGNDLPLKGELCEHVDHVCFVAGTMISTGDEDVAIESLGRGDAVLTRNGIRLVESVMQRVALVDTFFFSGCHALTCTLDHPVWSEKHGAFIPIDELQRDERIVTNFGECVFLSKARLSRRDEVFNLTVEDAHEYFANGILVSNCDAARYLICNVLDIAPETYEARMRTLMPAHSNPEPSRTI